MRPVSLSSLFSANVKYEKNGLKEVFSWHVEIPTKWKVYKYFSRSKQRPPCWKCSLHKQFKFHLKVRCTAIFPGETVLVRRPVTASKGATVYNLTPLTVVDKKGSMGIVTAQNENRTVTRNSSFFKHLDPSAVKRDNHASIDSGYRSHADIGHQEELPVTCPHVDVPDPS